jgi:hypothetical protein
MNAERRRAGRAIRRRRRIAAPLDGVLKGTGLVLLPWQREIAIRVLDGEQFVMSRGRKAGSP